MDNRPIKGNSSGKYSVVIDPTNDIAAYCNGQQTPQLVELIERYFETIQYVKPKMKEGASKSTVFKNTKQNAHANTCSVCLIEFKDKQKIKKLQCGHFFHDHCVLAWFKQKLSCPNCRFSLQGQENQFKQEQF